MKAKVVEFIDLVRTAMFPNIYHNGKDFSEYTEIFIYDRLQHAAILLNNICRDVLADSCCLNKDAEKSCDECRSAGKETAIAFMDNLPEVAKVLNTDIEAAYEGDPAAVSKEEILLSYPGFEAISIFRLAHELWKAKVPLIPRIMTEYAHSKTGIDIHPGATIGNYFFIDHGTGVVIGETCTIGEHVKIYQGVTLGAKSFELDENGNPVKGIKRHPDIEDNVIIYSGATILGGDTVVGKNSVIGGNVWLTHSVSPNSTVYNSTPSPIIKK